MIMFDKLQEIWGIIRRKESIESADSYPMGIIVGEKQYFAETLTLLLGVDRAVVGAVWGTQKHGLFESHHEPMRIWMNPKFQHHNVSEIPEQRDYDMPIYA